MKDRRLTMLTKEQILIVYFLFGRIVFMNECVEISNGNCLNLLIVAR